MRKHICLLLIFFLLFTSDSFSQERFGICSSIYSGISSLLINPANITTSPYKWDINICAANFYLDNNYVYINKTNVPDLITDNGKNPIVIDNEWYRREGKKSKFMLKNNNNKWNKNLYGNILIQGPSFMFSYKKWNFAFETAFRASASLTRFHYTATKLLFEGLTYEPFLNSEITIPKVRLNTAMWEEFGISAAREINRKHGYIIKGGITLKHINGLAGLYLLNKKNSLHIPNDTDIYFKNINLKYGYTTNGENRWLKSKGGGKSFDIGITIEKKTLRNKYQCVNFCSRQLELQYAWKLGVSLIDIGYIRFRKNVYTCSVKNKSVMWYNFNKIRLDDINEFYSNLNTHLNDDNSSLPAKNKFTMLMPWAASIQFDYNIAYNFYINADLTQRIPHFGLAGIDRANTIAITPRYDQLRFGVALPIVFYQYMQPRIGLAFRLYNYLFVGTDKIGSFIGNRLSGTDIYFALKFNIMKKCLNKKIYHKSAPSF